MVLERHPRPQRVAVRPAMAGDARLLFGWRSEPSVRRHQPLQDATLSELTADLGRQRIDDLYAGRGERFQWIILVDGEEAGWITLAIISWEHGLAEIGYALATAYQNQGAMTAALALLLPDLLLAVGLERLEARCSVENAASQRVLEKLGFEREARLKSYFLLHGRRVDNYLYALLRTDYLARRPR